MKWNRQFDDAAESVLDRGADSVIAVVDDDQPPIMYTRMLSRSAQRMLRKWEDKLSAVYFYFPHDLDGIDTVNCESVWIVSSAPLVTGQLRLSSATSRLSLSGSVVEHRLSLTTPCNVSDLEIDWATLAHGAPEIAPQLTRLVVSGFSGSELGWLHQYPNLETLALYEARNLVDVRLGDAGRHLKHLEVSGARKLTDLRPLASHAITIEELRLDSCTGLSSIEFVGALPNLRVLSLSDCGVVDDARPIASLRKLRELLIVGSTKFADPDVSAIAGLDLNRRVLGKRRTYRPQLADINA